MGFSRGAGGTGAAGGPGLPLPCGGSPGAQGGLPESSPGTTQHLKGTSGL